MTKNVASKNNLALVCIFIVRGNYCDVQHSWTLMIIDYSRLLVVFWSTLVYQIVKSWGIFKDSHCTEMLETNTTVWTVNDVLSRSIPLELSQSIPFHWVDPSRKKGYGSTQDVIDGPNCSYRNLTKYKAVTIRKLF